MSDKSETTVRDARTGKRIPAKPEWLWRSEWEGMIYGSPTAFRRWAMTEIRKQESASVE